LGQVARLIIFIGVPAFPHLLPPLCPPSVELVRRRGLSETEKTGSREKLAARIQLLHEVIQRGTEELLKY